MPDGSHWAVQSWQRGLPNLGFDPWKPLQSSRELRLSRWSTELPKLELWTNWAYSKRFHHVFGRFSWLGQPVFGFGSTTKGVTHGQLRAQHLPRHAQLGVRPRLEARELVPRPPRHGVFCYGFYPHDPYPGYPAGGRRPEGKGERYRATAIGPGVMPDVTWEGDAPVTYDEALDRQLVEAQRTLYAGDKLCKPV